MITIEQLKDIKERTEALNRYLDIEGKKIQVEEEQLRTQAPGFWDDQKAAEAQMKKVKGLQQWISGYNEVRMLADELQLEVVPVTIDGSFEILPRTGKWIHRHRMILTIHEPIPPKGKGAENIKASMNEAYAAVESALPEKYKGMVKNEDQDR